MSKALEGALRAVANMSPQDEFTERHEIAFSMRDEIYQRGIRAPNNIDQAKFFVRLRMPDEGANMIESVAEILLAATYRGNK